MVLFVFSLTVFGQNSFPECIRSALPSPPPFQSCCVLQHSYTHSLQSAFYSAFYSVDFKIFTYIEVHCLRWTISWVLANAWSYVSTTPAVEGVVVCICMWIYVGLQLTCCLLCLVSFIQNCLYTSSMLLYITIVTIYNFPQCFLIWIYDYFSILLMVAVWAISSLGVLKKPQLWTHLIYAFCPESIQPCTMKETFIEEDTRPKKHCA